MRQKTPHAAITLLALLFLGGCVAKNSYRYVPPATAEGRTCIQACEKAHEQCLEAVENEYETCLDLRAFDDRRYSDCRAGRRGIEHDNGGGCAPVQSCPPPNTLKCTDRYNECYRACGGEVK